MSFVMWLRRVIASLLVSTVFISCRPLAAEEPPLSPDVQRRVSTVLLARSIRAYAAMAQAGSNCLVKTGKLGKAQADKALVISLEELGISPTVLLNPLVQTVSPRLEVLLLADCSLDPDQEPEALRLIKDGL